MLQKMRVSPLSADLMGLLQLSFDKQIICTETSEEQEHTDQLSMSSRFTPRANISFCGLTQGIQSMELTPLGETLQDTTFRRYSDIDQDHMKHFLLRVTKRRLDKGEEQAGL